MTDLPPEFTYGYVMGQILLAVGDTADAGSMPDAKAATGKVTIKPKVLVTKTQIPTPATVIAQDIPCTLDAEGYLLDPNGNRGVWLVAGTYTVTYTIASASIPMHEILVTTDHTALAPLWLTSALPPGPVAPTPTQYAELTAQMANFALKSEVGSNEDVLKGVQAYEFQTGKKIVDYRGAPSTARPVALTDSMLQILVDATTTGNQTIDLLVDADSIVGRVVVFHVPTYNFRVKWHATNVVVESWPTTDAYQEIWGTLVFEDDGKWHVIASGARAYLKGAPGTELNIDLYGLTEKLTTGEGNVMAGKQAQNETTTGSYNTSVGAAANYSVTTGSYNTAIGVSAGVLWNKATINNIVAIGRNATVAVDSGVAIGYNSDVNDTHTNSVALGATVQTNAADQVAIGARDLEIQANGTRGVVLRSPNGTRYRVTVTDAGALAVAPA